MHTPIPWGVRENYYARGTAYLIDPDGEESGFFQTFAQAEDIARDLNSHAKLKADRDALLEALRPFAAICKELEELRHEDESTCPWRLKAGDIRNAAKAIAQAEKE